MGDKQYALPVPANKAIIYSDAKLYVCLATHQLAKGHTVIVWKDKVTDLHWLNQADYEYLMQKVNQVRKALMRILKVEKVYLMYMDEARQVHWHLIPRYNVQGYNVLLHKPQETEDFSLTPQIAEVLKMYL